MNTGIKLALLGVGGYVLYEYFYGSAAAAGTTTTPPAGTTTTPPAGTTTAPPPAGTTTAPPVSSVPMSPKGVILPPQFPTAAAGALADAIYSPGYAPTVAQLLVNAAGGMSTGLDVDQWSYYYSQLSGVQQTYEALNIPATQDRSTTMTVSAYLNLRTAAGLSGFRSRLGHLNFQAYPHYVAAPGRARQYGRFAGGH